MKTSVRYMMALVLLAAAPVAAQTTGRAGADSARGGRWEREGHRDRPAFQGLIEHRQELQLTDAQVSRLQEIGRRLDERNAPLRAQLAAHREQYAARRRAQMERLTPEQRRDTLQRLRQNDRKREVPEAMRAPMEQMRENIHAAMQEAQGVLTAPQKERARQLMSERRERMNADGQRGPHRRGGGWSREGRPQGQSQQDDAGAARP